MKNPDPARLNPRHRAFVVAFVQQVRECGDAPGNGTRAYKSVYGDAASYASIATKASTLRRHPGVQAAIALALAEPVPVVAPALESLESRASRIVPTDPLEAAPPMTVDEQAARLWAIGHNVGGGIKIADQMAALAHLAKLKGWNAERAEVSQQLVVFKIER